MRGCDPKKILVGNAEAIDWVRRLEGKGVRSDGLHLDWPELMRFKRGMIAGHSDRKEKALNDQDVEVVHGRARFVDGHTIRVGDRRIEAKKIAIATGAKPGSLGIAGEEHLTYSDGFLDLERLPNRIAFIGGGYISFEFAHVAARSGADAIILHRGSRPLKGFDADLAMRLAEKSRSIGIDIRLERQVVRIERHGSGLIVGSVHDGSEETVEVDMVVHGGGRVPAIESLDLDRGGVRTDRGRIVLNEFLQSTSNPDVYVAGDAAGTGPALTPVAGYQGRVAASNLIEGNHVPVDYSAIPSVVFTVPPLAAVGLGEDEAFARGFKVRVNEADTAGWYSSRRIGERHSGFKTIVDEETDRILGAHLLGPGAEETINLFAMAIHFGLTTGQIREMLFAYPTHGSDMPYMT